MQYGDGLQIWVWFQETMPRDFSIFENSPRDIQVICFSSPSNVHNAFKEKIKIVRQLLLYSFLVGNICYIQYFSITGTDNPKDKTLVELATPEQYPH
jgi:hypothetical protein